ncbi:MAG: hypothetical protein IT335_11280 [Thermomicrobiales bacterium]|nr:hypothetical protein [Thermomicrobiales bacterium]
MATTVRVNDRVAARLRDLALDEHRSIGQVIGDALDQYEREKFWQQIEQSMDSLKRDPAAWQEYQDEIRLLQGGSMDGLEDEAPYYSTEELEAILDQ